MSLILTPITPGTLTATPAFVMAYYYPSPSLLPSPNLYPSTGRVLTPLAPPL